MTNPNLQGARNPAIEDAPSGDRSHHREDPAFVPVHLGGNCGGLGCCLDLCAANTAPPVADRPEQLCVIVSRAIVNWELGDEDLRWAW